MSYNKATLRRGNPIHKGFAKKEKAQCPNGNPRRCMEEMLRPGRRKETREGEHYETPNALPHTPVLNYVEEKLDKKTLKSKMSTPPANGRNVAPLTFCLHLPAVIPNRRSGAQGESLSFGFASSHNARNATIVPPPRGAPKPPCGRLHSSCGRLGPLWSI